MLQLGQMRFGKNGKKKIPSTTPIIAKEQWTYDAARDCPSGSCVTEKIQKFPDILADSSVPIH